MIKGQRLLGGGSSVQSVTLAGVEVEKIDPSSSDVLVKVNAAGSSNTASGAVVVHSNSGSIVTGSPVWTYLEGGKINSITPSFGQLGTKVTITGERLLADGKLASSVSLAGSEATVVNASSTEVVVGAAVAKTVGKGDVVVTSDTGIRVTKPEGFEYKAAGFVADAKKCH